MQNFKVIVNPVCCVEGDKVNRQTSFFRAEEHSMYNRHHVTRCNPQAKKALRYFHGYQNAIDTKIFFF